MIPTRLPARGAGHRAFLIGMLGLAVAGAVAFVGSSPAHAATPQPVFGMRPSAEGQVPLPGGHFTYSVPAGSTLTDAVVVENLTERPLSLQLFGADLIPLQGVPALSIRLVRTSSRSSLALAAGPPERASVNTRFSRASELS